MEQRKGSELAWDGRRGNAWVDLQPMLDRPFFPLEQILADAAVTQSPRNVLDVGCGTGATTLAIARRLVRLGTCCGVDISEAMLNHARHRAMAESAKNARFLAGDAQRYQFETGSFDAVVSRFGVMFFDDPEAAFANIGNAVVPGSRLTSLVWRSREENPFMTAAERAAAPLLGWGAPVDPHEPGQFAWSDPDRVARLLGAAGWHSVDVVSLDVRCRMTEADLYRYARCLGPVGMILPSLESSLRDRVSAELDVAFVEFLIDGVVQFDAACWMVSAQAGSRPC